MNHAAAHYKPDFPDRNDEQFLKTTVAEHTPDGPRISYEDVDTSLVKLRLRKYTSDTPAKPAPTVKVALGSEGTGTSPINGNGVHANGTGENVTGYTNGKMATVIPGENTVNGGNGENDPLSTAPAANFPRDGGSGTEGTNSSPNMAKIEAGTGGQNN